jgi:hypothetical protein
MRGTRWYDRRGRRTFTILREYALGDAPWIARGITTGSGAFSECVAAIGRAGEQLCSLLPHELLFRFQIGIRIQSRHEIAIPLQQARCEYARANIRVQALHHRAVS